MIGLVVLGLVLLLGTRVRTELLPAIGLVLYALIPTKVSYALGMYWLYPGLVLIVVWSVRRGFGHEAEPRGSRKAIAVTAMLASAVLIYYLLVVYVSSGPNSTQSVWLISFGLAILLPVFVDISESDVLYLFKAWAVTAGVLGLYCFFESLLGSLPLYGAIYEVVGVPSLQHWDVYRSEGTFGHPLYAATFLGTGALAGVCLWLSERRWWMITCGVAGAIGMATTVSRGGFVAVAVGVGIAFVISASTTRLRSVQTLVIWTVFITLILGFVLTTPLLDRVDSAEAEGSTVVRDGLYQAAARVVSENGGFGAGLGSSNDAIAKYNPVGYVLESSYWQLMVGAGVAAVILLALIILLSSWSSLLGRNGILVVPALACYVTSISTYNAIDQLTTQHALLGMLIASGLAASSSKDDRGAGIDEVIHKGGAQRV